MTPLQIVGVLIAIVIVLFVIRGTYLLGRGSDAELEARSRSTSSSLLASGWLLLDGVRQANIPFLSTIESRLGVGAGSNPSQAIHKRCGSAVIKRGAAWYCPECDQTTTAIEQPDAEKS